MANIVIVGAQWGDEAKGKIIDYLASQVAMVVRFGGGNNAGHSVMVGSEEFKFHLIPAGILNPDVLCVIADGVVIDPGVLIAELEGLSARGISLANLKISGSAHVILPYHRLIERLQEEELGESKLGTTGRGIGPAYMDKAARVGIRMQELIDPGRFRERLQFVLREKNAILTKIYDQPPLDVEAILSEYQVYAEKLRPLCTGHYRDGIPNGAQWARSAV